MDLPGEVVGGVVDAVVGADRHRERAVGRRERLRGHRLRADAARGAELVSVYGDTLLSVGATLAEMMLPRGGRGR